MSARRIRCECGRVYEPAKHEKCPGCGAAAHVATIAAPKQDEDDDSLVQRDEGGRKETKPLAVSGRTIAIGAAVLLVGIVAVVALVRRPSATVAHDERAIPQPTQAVTSTPVPPPSATATAQPTATVAASATPPANVVFPQQFDLTAAIATAAPGATIQVPPGFYGGGIVLTKPVRLIATAGQSWIQSDGRECLRVQSPGVFVQGMQFMCNGIGDLAAISVNDGGTLELDGCRIQSSTALGVAIAANASLNAIGTTITAGSGTALRMQGGKASLTQTTISDAKLGITISNAGTAELKSCAFERTGTGDTQGGMVWTAGQGSSARLTDCQLNGNYGGLYAQKESALTVSGSTFKDNGANAKVTYGVIAVTTGAHLTLSHCTFDNNKQGVALTDRGTAEIDGCTFTRHGVQLRQPLLETMPISIIGQGSSATIRNTAISGSAQFGIALLSNASAVLENVEIANTKQIGLAVGDTSNPPAHIEVRKSKLHHNATAFALYAGSRARLEETEIQQNDEGIMAGDRNTQLEMQKCWINFNDIGLAVFNEARAIGRELQIVGNNKGAQSGAQRKSGGRASLTLEGADVGENKVYGVACFSNNELVLRRVEFGDGNKQNIYKERNAAVRTEEETQPETQPTPQEQQTPQASPTPDGSASPAASASPKSSKRASPQRQRSRGRRPEDEAARILRHIFRPN